MGHGHDDHHHAIPKIPKADFYKLEDAPELLKIQENLAKHGLKDPWIRNHVWRYNPKFGTERQRWTTMLFRGWKVGLAAFLLTIGAEKAFGITYGAGEHHDDHGEGGHH